MGYCCFGWFCLSFSALAMSEEHRFEPSQLEKIRNVGQGLLGAKRSYQQNPEIQNLKDEIEDIRKQIDSLIKSYDSDVSIDSTGLSKSSKKSIVPVASLDREELWRKKHAAKIDALVQAIGNLSQQMQATQKLQLKVNPKQKQSNNIEPKFGSISTAVVPTLANLHAEISSAIALPQEEQKKRIKAALGSTDLFAWAFQG